MQVTPLPGFLPPRFCKQFLLGMSVLHLMKTCNEAALPLLQSSALCRIKLTPNCACAMAHDKLRHHFISRLRTFDVQACTCFRFGTTVHVEMPLVQL